MRFVLAALLAWTQAATAEPFDFLIPHYQTEKQSLQAAEAIKSGLPTTLATAVMRPKVVPFSNLEAQLARPPAGPALFELPAHYLSVAIRYGWTPVYRLENPVEMALVVLKNGNPNPKRITTPPRPTIAYWSGTQMTDATLTATDSHAMALRGLVTGEADAAVTATGFIRAYGARFGFEFDWLETHQIPPSVIVRNSMFSKDSLAALEAPNQRFTNGIYGHLVPFDLETDLAQYEGIPSKW